MSCFSRYADFFFEIFLTNEITCNLFRYVPDIDECETKPGAMPICGSNSNCTNSDGSYSCECKDPKEYYSPTGDGKNCIGQYCYTKILQCLTLNVPIH